MENHLDFGTVFLYLAVFGVSLLFVKEAELYLYKIDGFLYRKKRKYIGVFYLGVALLFPCLLAAFRGMNVGRDVGTYIVDNFKYGQASGVTFAQFREHVHLQIPEPFFALLMYGCCKIGSIQFLFFMIEAFILIPVAYSMVKSGRKGTLTLEFALYYLLFYNFSLSAMRQCIAMSFVSIALIRIQEKKYIKSLFYVILAQLFHASVILVVAIMLVCSYIIKSKHRKLLIALYIGVLGCSFFGFSIFANRVVAIAEIVNPRYSYYIRHYFHSGIAFGDIQSTDFVVKSVLVLVPYAVMYKKRKVSNNDKLMLLLVFMGRYFVLFNAVFYESMRIAYYFDLNIVNYTPKSLTYLRGKNKTGYIFLYLTAAFLYWLYFLMYKGGYTTNLFVFNF